MFIKLIGIEFADQYFGKKQHSANKKHNSITYDRGAIKLFCPSWYKGPFI